MESKEITNFGLTQSLVGKYTTSEFPTVKVNTSSSIYDHDYGIDADIELVVNTYNLVELALSLSDTPITNDNNVITLNFSQIPIPENYEFISNEHPIKINGSSNERDTSLWIKIKPKNNEYTMADVNLRIWEKVRTWLKSLVPGFKYTWNPMSALKVDGKPLDLDIPEHLNYQMQAYLGFFNAFLPYISEKGLEAVIGEYNEGKDSSEQLTTNEDFTVIIKKLGSYLDDDKFQKIIPPIYSTTTLQFEYDSKYNTRPIPIISSEQVIAGNPLIVYDASNITGIIGDIYGLEKKLCQIDSYSSENFTTSDGSYILKNNIGCSNTGMVWTLERYFKDKGIKSVFPLPYKGILIGTKGKFLFAEMRN